MGVKNWWSSYTYVNLEKGKNLILSQIVDLDNIQLHGCLNNEEVIRKASLFIEFEDYAK